MITRLRLGLVLGVALLAVHCAHPAPALMPFAEVSDRPVVLVPQLGHSSEIEAIAVSPDGTLAASASDDDTIKIWALPTLRLVRTLYGHEHVVTAVAFSPDGRALASASKDGTIRRWDTTEWTLTRTMARSTGWWRAVAFTRDGAGIIAGGDDGLVRLDAVSGKVLETFAAPAGAVHAVAVSPRGDRLLSAGEDADHVVTLWDLTSGAQLAELTGSLDVVEAVAFSPGGARAIAGGDDGVARIWDVDPNGCTRCAPAQETVAFDHGFKAIDDLAFLPGGDEVLLTTGLDLRRWTPSTGRMQVAHASQSVTALAIAPDGEHYVAGELDWDHFAGFPVFVEPLHGEPAAVGSSVAGANVTTSVTFSADGETLYAGGMEGKVHRWDLRTLAHHDAFTLEDGNVGEPLFLGPGDRALLVGGDAVNPSELWDVDAGRERFAGTEPVLAHTRGPSALSPDGTRVASLAEDRQDQLVLWDADTGREVERFEPIGAPIWCARYLPDGTQLVTCTSTTVDVWDVATGALLHTFDGFETIQALAISADGTRAAVAGELGRTVLLDLRADEVVRTFTMDDLVDEAVAFSPDGTRLAAAGWGGTIRIWNTRTGALESTLAGHSSAVTGLAYAPGGEQLASSSEDGTLRLWRVPTGASVVLVVDGARWLAYTDDGYFDASLDGAELVAAVQGSRVYAIDQLALRNNRPDVLLDRLGLGSPEILRHYRARHDRRLAKLGLEEDGLAETLRKAPQVRLGLVQHGDTAEVTLDMQGVGAALLRYNLYANGVPLLGAEGRAIDGKLRRVVESITLGAGPNVIQGSVIDASGVESLRASAQVTSAPRTGDLYYVGFGVSRYRDATYDLGYPAKDVADLGAVLGDMTGFGHVHVATYTDDQATVASFAAARALLANAKVDDTVVVFVAGHGVHALDAAAAYYFITYETDLDDLAGTAASFDTIEGLLQDIQPRHKLLLLDTCESGERDPDDATIATELSGDGARARSIRKRARTATADAPRTFLFDRDRLIYNDVALRSGAIVLSSSRGEELSYELDSLANGVFTENVMTALTGTDADRDGDGAITKRELDAYVTGAVAAETEERQHPTVDRDNPLSDVRLPVTEAARGIVTRE